MPYLLIAILILINSSSHAMAPKLQLSKAIDRAIQRYGLPLEPQLKSYFNQADVQYPPQKIALLAFKKERHVQLWAKDESASWRYIHTYPLTAFSGRLGPKLKEHDLQIPEGIYRLTSFNPYSAHHLSMMINYPNSFDRLKASLDGRKKLGGNIFLHGKSSSVGCLAVGNKAIDQLFMLVRRVGLSNVKIIIAPNDLRLEKAATSNFAQPRWLPELYKDIASALKEFPVHKKLA
ncbi:L,D-transpeptidase family protein [Legionella yabuuchiae]|uniref:L,D-transpeptidase family protein n=1 Tax=Legionella yabuuchiae TaxID=376727 RepID=UPI001F5EDC81|nr:L,D-transpeptidase family protein [Legionella yabuuchiae]